MEFASEMVVKATLLDMRVTEVPTTLSPDGRSRPPHLRTWSDGWRHLRFLLLYSPRWLFLYPGLALLALGLGVGISVLPGPRTVGTVTFDVHTLLYAAAAISIGWNLHRVAHQAARGAVARARSASRIAFSNHRASPSSRADRLFETSGSERRRSLFRTRRPDVRRSTRSPPAAPAGTTLRPARWRRLRLRPRSNAVSWTRWKL